MITWLLGKRKIFTSQEEMGKDDFVSMSSHELRSPLSVIKWYTEMLLDEDAGPLTEDQRKYLFQIQSSNQRAIDLVRSLLNVSRLDLGTFSISPEPVSISSLAAEAVTFFAKDALTKNVELLHTEDSSVPGVSGDKHLVLLVIKQLLANAIAFSLPQGTVTLKVFQASKNEIIEGKKLKTESVLVSVTDTGIGIPDLDKPNIFSKMFKARNASDSYSTGSGLGLYIVKKVVDTYGGEVWFTSTEGRGSTFYVTFPKKGMKKKEGRTTLD